MKYLKLFDNKNEKGITVEVNDIIYDGDKNDDLSDLPTTMKIFVPVEYLENNQDLQEYVSDEISNKSGFTHKGFTIEIV